MKAHGNWCGPGWTAGQYKDAKDLTEEDRNVPAVDELDAHCKTHDILLHDYPDRADEINQEFIKQVKGLGIKGALFALAVGVAGPSPVSNLPTESNMPKLRNYKYEYPELPEETDAEREDFNRQYMSTEDVNVASNKDYETPDRPIRAKSQKMTRDDKPMSAAQRFPWKELAGLERSHKQSQSNLPVEAEMDAEGDVVMQSRSMNSSNTSNNSNGNKGHTETSIIYRQPNYLLQDMHTTILPITFYFSGVCGDVTATDLILSMNNYLAPLNSSTLIAAKPTPTSSNLGAVFSQGRYNEKIFTSPATIGPTVNTITGIGGETTGIYYSAGNYPTTNRWQISSPSFPSVLNAGTQPIPQLAEWWGTMYSTFAVLSCEYDITIIVNQHGNGNNDMLVASTIDTYGTNNTVQNLSNQMPTSLRLANIKRYKNIDYQLLNSNDQDDGLTVYNRIKGTYKPGSAKRMVINDTDVSTWTNVGQTPSYTEELHLAFFPHPLNTVHGNSVLDRTNETTGVGLQPINQTFNAEVTLKYIVQFRDLKRDLTYFSSGASSTVLNPVTYANYAKIANQIVP